MGKFPRRAAAVRALMLLRRAAGTALGRMNKFTDSAEASSAIAERLEKRQLLSAAAIHRPLGKLDSTLQYDYQNYATTGFGASATIQLQTYANPGQRSPLVAALKHLGSSHITGTGREVDAWVPVSNLARLTRLKSLRFASATSSIVDAGTVTSQGDAVDLAASARSAYNLSGANVTIGIISDSFNNNVNPNIADTYTTDVASGDLPSTVVVLSDNVPGTDEGRAIAQVIYDSAPGATLKFATGNVGDSTFAANINALVSAGCKIIVDDITKPDEPMFQDGVIALAAEKAISQGVTYISAAGNFAQQSYAANWSSGTTYTQNQITRDPSALNAPSTFFAGTSFGFGATGAGSDMDAFTLGAGQSINLSVQWDQPYFSASGGSGNLDQVDVYVLNSAGNAIEGGSITSVVGGDPIQHVTFTNPSSSSSNTYKLLIVSETGFSTPLRIKFVDLAGQATGWTYAMNSSTIFGHANAAGVDAVGAVNYSVAQTFATSYYNNTSTGSAAVEASSSWGGTPILFNASGGRLSVANQITRQEPVVTGPDAIANTFFGTPASGYYSFSGTSASAASVAGAVALLLQINPSLSPANVTKVLENTAIPKTTTPNFQGGYGFVQTVPAIAAAVGNVTGTVFSDNNFNGIFETNKNPPETGIGAVTVYIDLNNNGQLDAGEVTTTTAANGTFTFYNQATGNVTVRAVVPYGFISTTSTSASVTIVGASTSSAGNFGLFPISYNATTAVNYTLQLDTAKPQNFDVYFGSTLTYTAPLTSVPSLGFNFGNSNSTSSVLTVNYSSGSPIPAGGVTYAGDSVKDVLVVNCTSAADTVTFNGPRTYVNSAAFISAVVPNEIINGISGNDVFNVVATQDDTPILTFNGGGTTANNDTLNITAPLPIANNSIGAYFNAGTNSADQNTLNVSAGSYYFFGNPATTSANLTVNVGSQTGTNSSGGSISGNVVFQPGTAGTGFNQRSLAALNIGQNSLVTVAVPASHSDRAVLVTNSILVAPTGGLDLTGNDLIVTNGNLGQINSQLSIGFNGGLWNGAGGLLSTAAQSDSTQLTALGSILNNAGGAPLFGSGAPLGLFDGISPAPAAVLVKYTFYGDTNLDGKVDGTDYSSLDNAYLSQTNGTPLTGWANGDLNYDGTINGSDYTLMDNAYNAQSGTL